MAHPDVPDPVPFYDVLYLYRGYGRGICRYPCPAWRLITVEMVARAEEIAGIELTQEQREQLVEDLEQHADHYASIRQLALPNDVSPCTHL